MFIRSACFLFLIILTIWVGPGFADEPRKIPIILDTDLAGDIDDALALGLALASPELELVGITTVDGDAFTRALVACRFLHAVGRDAVPVAAGSDPRPRPDLEGQMQYGLRPCFRKRPEKERAVDFLFRQIKARPGEITLVAVGPLTNLAELFRRHPECKPWVKRIVVMGGSLKTGYGGKPGAEPEWNIKTDVAAARAVFACGVPLLLVPLDVTATLDLDPVRRRKIFQAGTSLTRQLEALFQLWNQHNPILFDPLAVALALEEKWCKLEELALEVDVAGMTKVVAGKANAHVATRFQREGFLDWFTQRLAMNGTALPPSRLPSLQVSQPVPRGLFPERVHVFEDFETDIEQRWWLCGLPETKRVPPGSNRACRGVLTNDFDDRMGQAGAEYTAVIFNPVPGPPMGPNTRLAFRAWLKGSTALKVQIYSLTKGYHRHLTLTNLAQEKWLDLTVDMTQARRPDGSGGALGADERIDDIQFYTDPGTELLIDDIVLYEASAEKETRPFPKRIFFTGWFDTGKQGQEWPGSFEIVAKAKPATWKAARAVVQPKASGNWIRLDLRGPRPIPENAELRFLYLVTLDAVGELKLVTQQKGNLVVGPVRFLAGKWREGVVSFPSQQAAGMQVTEVVFLVPADIDLHVDDVLLYQSGTKD